jgi:hypothetical protein
MLGSESHRGYGLILAVAPFAAFSFRIEAFLETRAILES